MSYKMVKRDNLALLILIFIITLLPVSCDNNSSINSTKFDSTSNASESHQPSSDISETKEAAPSDNSNLDLIDKYIKVILGIFALIAIPIGLIRWLLPDAEKRLRIRIRGILGKNEHIENDLKEPINPSPEKESPKTTIRLSLPNPNFTGRQKFLSTLSQSLLQATTSPKIFALVGNGGMGKTQIALQHAHNPENNFRYVWWLRSEEPATLLKDYISIARDLHLPGWDLRDTDQTVKKVEFWLEGQGESRWLLVFDNAKEPKDLERYVPVAGNGQIIITSRLSVWDGFAQLLMVGVFQRDKMEGESVDFLLIRTGRADRKGASDLAAELGDLPLALEQAGAYIKESGISFSDYLARLKENRKELLRKGKPQSYPESVATTWEISFQAVQEENPSAGDLLSLFAFLAPDSIPRDLLEKGAKLLPEPLSLCVRNSGRLDDCISVLSRYSLISAADNLISIHRLVQAVVQDRLSLEDQRIWAESALRMVNDAFSFSQLDMESWKKCSRLSSHAISASEHAERLEVSSMETADLLNSLGRYLNKRMELASARAILERALAIDEKALGSEHPSVARDVNNLGSVLQDQGDLEGAKKCFQRSLAIDEKALGPDHPSVAIRASNLGLVLRDQGDLERAKKCLQRSLAIDEKALGPDHPSVAIRVNNLGLVLQAQGDLEGARKCFERALAIDEKALGSEHTSVAVDVNNLGSVLKAQGDLEGARRCAERALAIEKRLGKDHPNSVLVRNNLRKLQK
jgi:tetratricopeptide (TPR) repeat protein